MAADTTDPGTAGERQVTMTSTYTLTGDILADRAAWKAAGCPSDHPYIIDCAERVAAPAEPVRPLAIDITDAQWDAVQAAAPIMRAQSDANIRAMWSR